MPALFRQRYISVLTVRVFAGGKVCRTFARNAFRELRVSPFIGLISEIVQKTSLKISTGRILSFLTLLPTEQVYPEVTSSICIQEALGSNRSFPQPLLF